MAEAALKDETHECWEKFHHWMCCICVVTFDLELGQALEVSILSMLVRWSLRYYVVDSTADLCTYSWNALLDIKACVTNLIITRWDITCDGPVTKPKAVLNQKYFIRFEIRLLNMIIYSYIKGRVDNSDVTPKHMCCIVQNFGGVNFWRMWILHSLYIVRTCRRCSNSVMNLRIYFCMLLHVLKLVADSKY